MSELLSTLVMSGDDHNTLSQHLYPGDGKEAAAILLCSRIQSTRLRLMVKHVHCVPHDLCDRRIDWVTWPGQHIEDCLTAAEESDLSLILVHSHPSGCADFSETDDQSDLEVLSSLFLARDKDKDGEMLHGSAILLPSGWIRARVYSSTLQRKNIDLVTVIGDNLIHCWNDTETDNPPLAFSSAMRDQLNRLHVGLVGVSGTGSIVSEQLLRLGFGEITVVDHDIVEHKNLNRILNSTATDARSAIPKVDLFSRTAAAVFPDAIVHSINHEIGTHEAIKALAEVDVLFCCVDTATGRDLCQRLATSLLLPLFDVGVVIPIRKNLAGKTVIHDIQGRVDYIQPAGSSLVTRGVYRPCDLAAEDLSKRDPNALSQLVQEGYMPGINEEAPSVIAVNMRAASMVVQEFIARAFPYRLDDNRSYARTIFALASEEQDYFSEDDFQPTRNELYASALTSPLLGLPTLGVASWDF